MRNTRKLSLLLLWVFALAASLSYGADPFVLSKAGAKELNDNARKLYEKGLKRLDRINYEGALDCFLQAQEAAPEAVQIRFVTARLATSEAAKRTANEAAPLLEKARAAYQAILDMKEKGAYVRRPDVRRAESGVQATNDLVANLETRDQERATVGKAVLDTYTMEIESVRKVKTKEEQKKEKELELKERQDAAEAAAKKAAAASKKTSGPDSEAK